MCVPVSQHIFHVLNLPLQLSRHNSLLWSCATKMTISKTNRPGPGSIREPGGGTPSLKVVGRLPGTHGLKNLWAPKKGVKILCVAAELKNRGQKSICGHKKGGQYSMSHWKIGVKILCVVLKRGSIFYGSLKNRGQNSMKAKIWGSKFYFFLVEPLAKILCSLKRGVKILYFFPVPWKRGVKTAEPTNQLHWRGAPPGYERWVNTGNGSLVNWRKGGNLADKNGIDFATCGLNLYK